MSYQNNWCNIRLPRVHIYNGEGQLVIGEESNIAIVSFSAELKDDGKDDVRMTLRSKDVGLLGSYGIQHGTLIYLSWGYHTDGMRSTIPYLVNDVTNTYSNDGLTVDITCTDLISPFDYNSGLPEDFSMAEPALDKDGNTIEDSWKISPLDFICNMMGENLQFYFNYNGKQYLVKDEVKVGNGFIPTTFHYDLWQFDITGGIFSAPQKEMLARYEHDNTSWMKDLPESIWNFLTSPRNIDISCRRHITILQRLIAIMPEGPWFINRRANVFIIHNRGGVGNGSDLAGKGGRGSGVLNFNFKNDINTILSFKIKYDGKALEDDSENNVELSQDFQRINITNQYNGAVYELAHLWKSIYEKKGGIPDIYFSNGKVDSPSVQGRTTGTNRKDDTTLLDWRTVKDKTIGDPFKWEDEDGNKKTYWGGYEIDEETYNHVNELLALARELFPKAGVQRMWVYYQEAYETLEKSKNNKPRLSTFSKNGAGGMNASPFIMTDQFEVVQNAAKYTLFPFNEKTGAVNLFRGVSYWQASNDGDSFWQTSNSIKEKAITAITATLIVEGNPYLVEGVYVNLTGVGYDSGIYYVSSVRHVIDSSGGYKTELNLNRLPKSGISTMINNARLESANKKYDPEDIFKWAVYLGIDIRVVATRDAGNLVDKFDALISREDSLNDWATGLTGWDRDENGKLVKKTVPNICSLGIAEIGGSGTLTSELADMASGRNAKLLTTTATGTNADQERLINNAIDLEEIIE